MKLLKVLAFGLVALTLGVGNANAAFVIANDPGGIIDDYEMKYDAIHRSGGYVVIDGDCVSACTLAVGMIRADKLCMTPAARLGFHSAFVVKASGKREFSPESTADLWAHYPEGVKRLLRTRGWYGNTPHPDLIWIGHEELQGVIRECE